MPRTFREQTARLLIELVVVGVDIINIMLVVVEDADADADC